MPEDLCQRWVYIEIHVKQNFTIMYIDRKEIFKTLINFDVDEISGLNITLGGIYGFFFLESIVYLWSKVIMQFGKTKYG